MFDAQNVLLETGRVALWRARGASARYMVEIAEGSQPREAVKCTAGMTGVNGWGVGWEMWLSFLRSSPGKAHACGCCRVKWRQAYKDLTVTFNILRRVEGKHIGSRHLMYYHYYLIHATDYSRVYDIAILNVKSGEGLHYTDWRCPPSAISRLLS
jgi:hypothetical protein